MIRLQKPTVPRPLDAPEDVSIAFLGIGRSDMWDTSTVDDEGQAYAEVRSHKNFPL
jgi:hypothetical protein